MLRVSRCAAALAAAVFLPSAVEGATGVFSDSAAIKLAGHPQPTTGEPDTITVTGRRERSLTSPDAASARQEIEHIPGGVDLVEADEWRDTAARTLKDVLDWTPGVFVQPKWGEDARLSIRGSGLSRNFHLRGVQLLIDGIPMNAADGSADFQEIDPTAFAYSEVYKGANALRYGANALGGALQFVSPTGLDASGLRLRTDGGSFGLRRAQFTGGVTRGAFDAHLAASALAHDGFRNHSDGDSRRASANLGWRLGPNLESRIYVLGADIEQRIPGAVARDVALHRPRTAASNNLALDYQRNMQSWRVANKTTWRHDGLQLEAGAYLIDKQLIHPVFQYLDYDYQDRGAFLRASLDHRLGEHTNRVVFGVNGFGGHIDNQQFQNLAGGARGDRLSASKDSADNLVVYLEDQLQLTASLTLIAGVQHLDARREREDRFNNAVDTSGRADYRFTTPKFGLLWQASPQAQVYANLSRSAETPTFGELNFTNAALADTRAQRSTTVEVGTRGGDEVLQWDVSGYRAQLRNEFQFFDLGDGNFQVTNADDTVHQGVEAALDWRLAQSLIADGDRLTWRLAYAFNDFFFDDDASWGNNRLPGSPRHFLRSQWRWDHAGGGYLAPHVEWVPQGYDVDNANSVQTRAYALLGVRAGYAAGARWSVYLDARNLADTRYIASSSVVAQATAASAIFEPGDGLALFAGVSLNLPW